MTLTAINCNSLSQCVLDKTIIRREQAMFALAATPLAYISPEQRAAALATHN